jgi:putative ABC transport system permease protein
MYGWDVRLALRRLVARPGYSVLLILIIAVGIGAATAVFSIVDQLLLRPPPFIYADRLVDVLDTVDRATHSGGNDLSMEKISGWQAQPALFERFEAYGPRQMDITRGAEPERTFALNVSLGLFSMLGVQPRLGRAFVSADGRPGAERVAIISDDLWRRRFAAQSDVLGRRLRLNDEDYTIVGVMPRRFRLLMDNESVWLPIDVAAHVPDLYGLGRLARGVPMASAQAIADGIADHLQQVRPLARGWDLALQRKRIAWVDPATTKALFVLLGAVSFVLLIMCANVASLILSQAPLRLREMAIRSALGAGRARLFRSVLVESVLLAAAGGALGIALAGWGVDALLAAAPARLAFMTTSTIELDSRVVAAAIAATLMTGILIGLLPAVRGSRAGLEATLRGTGPAARASFSRAPATLVVLEVSFSVVLLIGATLMARTFVNLEAISTGFEPSGLVALHVDLPTDRYPGSASRAAFFERLFERLKSVPGISDAAVAHGVPPEQGGFTSGTLQSEEGAAAPERAIVPINIVSPDYFRTLRIPILAGRTFDPHEPAGVVIVSEGLAHRLWPEGGAIGRRFRIGANDWLTTVGVAGNVETRAAGADRTVLQLYYPWVVKSLTTRATTVTSRRRTYDWRLLIVRAANPSAALPEIKRQVWALDPNQPIEKIALVDDTYAEAFARQRFLLLLMSAFSAIALALTAAGLVGVLSQLVMRRTREIGVRMALGARPGDVLRLVLSQGLAMTLIGVVAGLAAALWLTRVLRTLLFGITPTDPLSFAVVGAFLAVVAAIACWVPARSAMRIDPAVALRVD